MKILMFGKDLRALRREAASMPSDEPITFGFRLPSAFNAKNPEPCDLAIVRGNFPEISAAYEKPVEKTAKPKK